MKKQETFKNMPRNKKTWIYWTIRSRKFFKKM